MYFSDLCELLFTEKIIFEKEEDYGVGIEFYLRAKLFVITSRHG
jgi:hypothetical protein